jgi:Photosynthetic reaction centre cytochrome C subunit
MGPNRKQNSIPAAEVDRTMKLFTRAPGVECTFCHVENDWKNASKPQWQTSLAMWHMVQTLNSEQLANTPGVTCVRYISSSKT